MAGLDHPRDCPGNVGLVRQKRGAGHEDRIAGPGDERVAYHTFRQVQMGGGGKQAGE